MEEPVRRRNSPGRCRSEPSPGFAFGGLLLDRFVHRTTQFTEVDATSSAVAQDCVGRPIRVSLRIAETPAVSRLYLHTKDMPDLKCAREPFVIAAHQRSILFNVTVPFEDAGFWNNVYSGRFPEDYFVYSACTSPPSLKRLPPCFEGGYADPSEDKYFKPYQYRQQRAMSHVNMGIVCHGSRGEFTVADLTNFVPEAELCLLHHPGSSSSGNNTPQWRVKKVRAPMSAHLKLNSWMTDTVIPWGDRFLFWVDYYQGILILDVLRANAEPNEVEFDGYIPMPMEALQSGRLYPERESMDDPARCVYVSTSGTLNLKLVCIEGIRGSRTAAFTIKAWTFVYGQNRNRWCKDFTMRHSELWKLYGGKGLPCVKPCYPRVSLVDPNVICFLLKDKSDVFWIIQVNMMKKVLMSSALYINEEEEEMLMSSALYIKEEEKGSCSTGRAPRYIGHPFILSNISDFLCPHATKSQQNLSKMMQKAKLYRVMQKSGLDKAVMQNKTGVEEAELERFAGLKMSGCQSRK